MKRVVTLCGIWLLLWAGIAGAFAQIGNMLSGPVLYRYTAVVLATLDPSKTGTANGCGLSGGNLVLTGTASVWCSSLTVTGHSAGKYYFETTVTALQSNFASLVGVGNSSANLNSWLGVDTNSLSAVNNGGWYYNSTSSGAAVPWNGNVVFGVAVDIENALIWLQFGGACGTWYGATSSGNPASGTGGEPTQVTGPLFAGMAVEAAGQELTANFGQSAYSCSAPSGFNNW